MIENGVKDYSFIQKNRVQTILLDINFTIELEYQEKWKNYTENTENQDVKLLFKAQESMNDFRVMWWTVPVSRNYWSIQENQDMLPKNKFSL